MTNATNASCITRQYYPVLLLVSAQSVSKLFFHTQVKAFFHLLFLNLCPISSQPSCGSGRSLTLIQFSHIASLYSLVFSFILQLAGSVRSDQVISGLIGRLMFLPKPGTLTCLSSSLVHFLPIGVSQTRWRHAETHTTVFFEDFSLSQSNASPSRCKCMHSATL